MEQISSSGITLRRSMILFFSSRPPKMLLTTSLTFPLPEVQINWERLLKTESTFLLSKVTR